MAIVIRALEVVRWDDSGRWAGPMGLERRDFKLKVSDRVPVATQSFITNFSVLREIAIPPFHRSERRKRQ